MHSEYSDVVVIACESGSGGRTDMVGSPGVQVCKSNTNNGLGKRSPFYDAKVKKKGSSQKPLSPNF
jgi:hypothetical protein